MSRILFTLAAGAAAVAAAADGGDEQRRRSNTITTSTGAKLAPEALRESGVDALARQLKSKGCDFTNCVPKCFSKCDLDDEIWVATSGAVGLQLFEDKESDEGCVEGGDGLSTYIACGCSGDTEALLKFDLDDYKGRAIDEAKLLIYTEKEGNENLAYRMGEKWDKKTTWAKLGGVEGARATKKASFKKPAYNGVGYQEYDVTTDVGKWLAGKEDNYGWGFVNTGCGTWDFWGPKANKRPYLYIKFTGKQGGSDSPKPPKLKRKECKSAKRDAKFKKWSYDAGTNDIQGCEHVAIRPEKRCARIGTKGLPAQDACCKTCAPYDCSEFGGKDAKECDPSSDSCSKDDKKWRDKEDGMTCRDVKESKDRKKLCRDNEFKGEDKDDKIVTAKEACCETCKKY